MMRIRLTKNAEPVNFTGVLGDSIFDQGLACVISITPRLKSALAMTGYEIEEIQAETQETEPEAPAPKRRKK